tara:strand:+ start:13477 stop:13950 length:474 start_codon:yes stop_codon:yes gene_type:complete
MKIKFDKVRIHVSELQTSVVEVAPWETPILQAIYGEEEAVVEESFEIERERPDAADEFARLANRYGPKNSDTPVVAAVYGSYGPGVAKLESAITEAFGAEGEAPVPASGLSNEEIAAIEAKDDAKQAAVVGTEIIEPAEPQPPVLTQPAEDELDDLL